MRTRIYWAAPVDPHFPLAHGQCCGWEHKLDGKLSKRIISSTYSLFRSCSECWRLFHGKTCYTQHYCFWSSIFQSILNLLYTDVFVHYCHPPPLNLSLETCLPAGLIFLNHVACYLVEFCCYRVSQLLFPKVHFLQVFFFFLLLRPADSWNSAQGWYRQSLKSVVFDWSRKGVGGSCCSMSRNAAALKL